MITVVLNQESWWSSAVVPFVSVIVGGLITLGIQYLVVMREERKNREHDRQLALADRREDMDFTRRRADEDRWERWADELSDVATGELLDAGPAWVSAMANLRYHFEDVTEADDGRVPRELDDAVHLANRAVSRVGLRITELADRLLTRPGAPADDLSPLFDARDEWAKAFDAILRGDGISAGADDRTRIVNPPTGAEIEAIAKYYRDGALGLRTAAYGLLNRSASKTPA